MVTEQKRVFVVDVSRSPYAKLKPVSISDVKITGGFWRKRLNTVFKNTLMHIYKKLEETDRINRFRWASRGQPINSDKTIYPFDDTDVYKWIEACAYKLAQTPDEELEKLIRQVVSEISAAQEPDGYLFTEYHGRKDLRWRDLAFSHELYSAGHLMQAAIALHRATGSADLLNIAAKFADLIADTFKPGGLEISDGHPNIEMALVELYRETGRKRYLDCSINLLEFRGRAKIKPPTEEKYLNVYRIFGGAEYFVDHIPFKEAHEIAGHAVRALYLNCGATDIYMETGEEVLLEALDRLWRSLTASKMYVTGGAGSRYITESFGEPYELPNMRAYSETCAAVANFMWNWRMLLATGEARFGDLMELTLYNGVLSGISLDGTKFFYVNPLASRGRYKREEWFLCACCPPNVARLLTSLPGYIYSTSKDGIWIHLYLSSEATIRIDGLDVRLIQETDYPWDGKIKIKVNPSRDDEFKISLRIPKWCDKPAVKVNRRRVKAQPGAYLVIERMWEAGDIIELNLPMPVKPLVANLLVEENFGKVALTRGPLIYCFEGLDNRDVNLWNVILTGRNFKIMKASRRLPDDIIMLQARGVEFDGKQFENNLYIPIRELKRKKKSVKLVAIPYYAWANRGATDMRVWVPATEVFDIMSDRLRSFSRSKRKVSKKGKTRKRKTGKQ